MRFEKGHLARGGPIPNGVGRATNRSLTPEQARQVRARKGSATATEVAAEFGCGPDTVREIWKGRSYRDVE